MSSENKIDLEINNNNNINICKEEIIVEDKKKAKPKDFKNKNWIKKLKKGKGKSNKKLNYEVEFNIDGLGTSKLAKLHCDANRPLKKIRDFDQSTKFCPCCSLPVEQKGYIEKFKFCENTDEFIQCGTGISLYFSFFRFTLFILAFASVTISIPTLIITNSYTNDLMDFCYKDYENKGNNINETFQECHNFISVKGISKYFIKGSDWALRFNGINLKQYRILHYISTGSNNIYINKSLLNYGLIYFICLLSLFVINLFYIILIFNINKRNDMSVTTPGDYTVMISNLHSAFEIYWNKINKINYIIRKTIKEKNSRASSNSNLNRDMTSNEQNFFNLSKFDIIIPEKEELGLREIPKDKEVNILEGFNEFIRNRVCVSADGEKYNIKNLNICYKIDELKKTEDEIQKIKSQILKIYYDPKQKMKNEQMNLKDDKRKYFIYPLRIYGINLCECKYCEKSINLSDLQVRQMRLENNLEYLVEQSKYLSIGNFTGVIFVTFDNKNEQEKFLRPYPKSFIVFLFVTIKNLKYYICKCLISKQKRKRFFLKRNITAEAAPEPEEIQFENLQTTSYERLCRTLSIYFISLIIIGISFLFISRLNIIQKNLKDQNDENGLLIRYILSLTITVVISIINVIFEICLEGLTKVEKHITMTNYYLSYSIKLTLFTFITSSIIPLVSNYVNNKDDYDLLVTNMFVMFLSNSFVTPIMWTVNPKFFLKKLIQCFLEKKKIHYFTQKELNDLYELPDMKISNKYSYLAKTLLMTFLYIPIFPLGILISLIGLLLAYYLEKYNFIYMYKRPEMLNSNLCEFYSNYFVLNYLMLAIGNYIFIKENNENDKWNIVNLNLFGLLILIPYNQIFSIDFIGIKESQLKTAKTYDEVYFNFYNDYERTNPMTKKEGMKRFIYKLKEKGYINTIDEAILKSINNINLMEIYYKTRQNFSKSLIQRGLALYDSKKGKHKYNNILKRLVKGTSLKERILKAAAEEVENTTISDDESIGYSGYNFEKIKKNNDLSNHNNISDTNKSEIYGQLNKILKSNFNELNKIKSHNKFVKKNSVDDNSKIKINININNVENIEKEKITSKSDDNRNNIYEIKEESDNNNDCDNDTIIDNNNDIMTIDEGIENQPKNPIEYSFNYNEHQQKILSQYNNPFHFLDMEGLDELFNQTSSNKSNKLKDSNINININNDKKEEIYEDAK